MSDVDTWIRQLESPIVAERIAALEALGGAGALACGGVPAIVEAARRGPEGCTDPPGAARTGDFEALRAMQAIGKAATAALVAISSSGTEGFEALMAEAEKRQEARRALRALDTGVLATTLRNRLLGPDTRRQAAIVWCRLVHDWLGALARPLRKAEPPKPWPALVALADSALDALVEAAGDQDWYVRSQAIQALACPGVPAERALPVLTGALNDPQEIVRESAASTLGRIGPAAAPAVPALIAALGSAIDVQAATALGRIGPAAKDALAALKKLTRIRDEKIRDVAKEAIGRIEGR